LFLAADIACGAELYVGRRAKGKLFFVSFARAARQNGPMIGAFLNALGILLGSLLGRLLALQKISNYLGRRAAGLLAGAGAKPADGFVAVTILFCAAPLGLVGAVTDGLENYFFPLALKAVMDGLATTSFVKMFRWPVALAAAPVFLFLNGLAVIAHAFVLPKLAAPELHSINAAAGLLICSMTLVILEVRRVELANYLPALFLAPILSRLLA
jgi:uncharacterized membrane protein YqgA involved in biofilm formation